MQKIEALFSLERSSDCNLLWVDKVGHTVNDFAELTVNKRIKLNSLQAISYLNTEIFLSR